jgi:hypothetical protein
LRTLALAVLVFPCLHAVLSAQVPISEKREQATQTQKARPPLESSGSASFDVGKFPIGVVSDGTNIWVANGGSNTVTKLRASDGGVTTIGF